MNFVCINWFTNLGFVILIDGVVIVIVDVNIMGIDLNVDGVYKVILLNCFWDGNIVKQAA